MKNDVEVFWQSFLSEKGLAKDTKYFESFHFELTERSANELLNLVLIGEKKATSSSLLEFELSNSEIPKVKDFSILTDWVGTPHCVIQTKKVNVLPFKEITYDLCKLEGEDDDLASWQRGHISFFQREGKALGYSFTEDMPVIFEEFEVVYQK